jgi:protein gp37
MGVKTDIQWSDSTINPTTGCEGCELWGPKTRVCYAGNLHETRLAKSMPLLYAADFSEVRVVAGRMTQAASWPDLRGKEREDKPWLNSYQRVIFVGDMGDFMSKDVPDDYIEHEIFGAIESRAGSRHFWLLLTKQIRRLAEFSINRGGLPDNCMAMTTVTNQHYADKRVPDLLKVECKWKGVSAEPLWDAVSLKQYLSEQEIHWVIIGGESEQRGVTPNPFELEWGRSLINECIDADVPAFVKQLGSRSFDGETPLTLRDSKGGDWSEWPEELQVREMPKLYPEVTLA